MERRSKLISGIMISTGIVVLVGGLVLGLTGTFFGWFLVIAGAVPLVVGLAHLMRAQRRTN